MICCNFHGFILCPSLYYLNCFKNRVSQVFSRPGELSIVRFKDLPWNKQISVELNFDIHLIDKVYNKVLKANQKPIFSKLHHQNFPEELQSALPFYDTIGCSRVFSLQASFKVEPFLIACEAAYFLQWLIILQDYQKSSLGQKYNLENYDPYNQLLKELLNKVEDLIKKNVNSEKKAIKTSNKLNDCSLSNSVNEPSSSSQ